MSDYFYAAQSETPGAVCLFAIQGVDDDYLFGEGVPVDELGVGDDPHFEIDGSFSGPLEDVVKAMGHTLVVSDKVRRLIEEFDTTALEFIPVDLRDSKGKTVASYHVCHPINLPDVLDDGFRRVGR